MKSATRLASWLTLFTVFFSGSRAMAGECHYQEWRWNVIEQRAVLHRQVIKDYLSLMPEELDPSNGCSVCIEDQQEVLIEGLAPFMLCRRYAPVVEATLRRLIEQGEKIESVIAYRVGRTRGEVDEMGNRTTFSNHSYGVALDINTAHNGLYDQCNEYTTHCRLLRGGPWRPGSDPYSLRMDGPIVSQLREAGFRWGGTIEGQQKDFMHFSPTGY